MDARTLTALKGSIAKWEAIVAGTGKDLGTENCPLCEEFYQKPLARTCSGCPVAVKTGAQFCDDTPYVKYHRLLAGIAEDNDEPLNTPVLTAAAQAELDFLKSLLP